MIEGVKKIVRKLHAQGKLDGIISLGGSTGSAIGTSVMSTLPIGVPKFMVATGFELQFVGAKDITIMQTPADILGLNSIMRQTLASAAGAIVGMAEARVREKARPLIGITALGVTTPAVMSIKPLIEEMGYEALVFHSKTPILDELIGDDRVSGVIDLTTFEIMIPLSFHLPAEMAEGRLSIAGEKGLPQVIVPGGLDMFIFPGTKETVPPEYSERRIHVHGPDTVLVRTTGEEVATAGKLLAKRANSAKGPVAIMIPLGGFSAVDAEGQHFYDPQADAAFVRVIKDNIENKVDIIEVNANINDIRFARKVVDVFDKLLTKGGVRHG